MINACASPKSDIYEFDPRLIDGDPIVLSDIADSISYIPLDSVIPLNRIINIVISKNSIYLSSRNMGILKYDRTGLFKNNIGSIGRGPGEYVFYQTFSVDDRSGDLYNLSDRTELIQVYSGDGSFIRSFSLKDYGTSISALRFYNSMLFAQCDNNFDNAEYDWIVYDTLGNIIRKQPRHLSKFTTNYGGITSPYIYKDRLSYFNTWTDTVYSILPSLSEVPSLIISPGEHRYPRSFVTDEEFKQKKFLALQRIFETKRFFIIKYFYQKYFLAFVEKSNEKTYLNQYHYDESIGSPISGIENDIDGGIWFLPETVFTENEQEFVVGITYPNQIKEHAESTAFKNSKPKDPVLKANFESLAKKLKETDNPVIVLVKLKK